MSLNVEGQICPVCKGHLFNDDDIVYCPVCGAPHHRECYASIGHCGLEELHGTERQYQRPQDSPEEDETPAQDPLVTCRYCGTENPKTSLFCERCGHPLGAGDANNAGANGPLFGGAQNPFVIDPLGGVRQDETIDGVPVVDVARFVMLNTARYIPIFKRISKKNRISWNWGAFLFPEGWLFYRKCYKPGVLFLMISIAAAVLLIPTQVFANNVIPPDAYTSEQMWTAVFSKINEFTPFMQVTLLFSFIFSLGCRIICGLFGDYLYRTHAITSIKRLQGQSDYSELLPRAGGVSLMMLLIVFAISYWIPTAVSLFI